MLPPRAAGEQDHFGINLEGEKKQVNLVSLALEAGEAARWVCGGREEPEGCNSLGYPRALTRAEPVASHT